MFIVPGRTELFYCLDSDVKTATDFH